MDTRDTKVTNVNIVNNIILVSYRGVTERKKKRRRVCVVNNVSVVRVACRYAIALTIHDINDINESK